VGPSEIRWLLVVVAMFAVYMLLTRLGKITGQRARELVKSGAKLIDVRSPSEFAGGHIDGAENVPVDRIGSRAAALAKEGRPVVVYCASGMRSASAKRALKSAGVEVYDLGGMGRW
jgi:phage shock protein E